MGERVVLPVDERKGVIAWTRGVKVLNDQVDASSADLRIVRTRTEHGVRVEKGWLVQRLQPEVVKVLLSTGHLVEVQTFRCWSAQHVQRWLMVCGTCGDMAFGDMGDVHEAAVEGCRSCGAGLGCVECVTPHTFGSCLHCPCADPSVLLPFAVPGASAEDSRSTKAGPSAQCSGSGSDRRVVEVDEKTGEVYAQR
jgi:hypothetical protein